MREKRNKGRERKENVLGWMMLKKESITVEKMRKIRMQKGKEIVQYED